MGVPAGSDDQTLSPRQQAILKLVVEEYIRVGQPIGSKHVAGRDGLDFSSSTVRYELARLETLGYLSHPHTSAGRVPTDLGYRYYVDVLVEPERLPAPPAAIVSALDTGDVRREIDAALRRVADAIAQTTNLLGVVTAPPLVSATIRHVEVIALQPRLAMVVVITSVGDVSKRVVSVDEQIDQHICDWAAEFFNERVVGVAVGSRTLQDRLADPSFTPREARLLRALSGALADLDIDEQEGAIFVGGQAGLLADAERRDTGRLDVFMRALEERYALLALLREALGRSEAYLRIGSELPDAGLSGLSMVAASYGSVRRNLGTVSVFGPTRMDYRSAIVTVRAAAHALSEYVEEVFE